MEQTNLNQNCDCYSGENLTVCPFCNATTSQSPLIYQYVESLQGESDRALWSSRSSLDLTLIYRTEDPTCSLNVSLVCWYDVLGFVTDYSTVSLHQEVLSTSSCSASVELVTPLACNL